MSDELAILVLWIFSDNAQDVKKITPSVQKKKPKGRCDSSLYCSDSL